MNTLEKILLFEWSGVPIAIWLTLALVAIFVVACWRIRRVEYRGKKHLLIIDGNQRSGETKGARQIARRPGKPEECDQAAGRVARQGVGREDGG